MSHSILCSLVGLCLSSVAVAADRPPNVLFIVADDHSADVYGAYGNARAHTPRLDRLAAEGVRFTRAYANSPMCTSSRQSFLTGRYPHCNGVTMLRHVLPESAYTLADRLRDAGYRAGAFGKMHFNAPFLHGFEVHRTRGDWNALDRRRENRPIPAGLEVLPPWRPFRDPARIWLNGIYRPFGRWDAEMPDTWYAEQAIAFMREHRDEPFFVQVGFHEPHSPFLFPVEYAGRRDPESFEVPTPGPEDADQVPKEFADLTRVDKQGIKASYYTSVEYMDSLVGRLLDAVDDMHLRDETLVVYIGDHGYHLGEHGRFEKHCFFERAVRAPLVIRYPGHLPAEASRDELAEFVDIYPTILDYLGLKPGPRRPSDQPLQGRSLRPVVERRAADWRDAAFSEYQPTQEAMVRTPRYKLIYRTAGPIEDWMGYEPVHHVPGRRVRLYDMTLDPEEMHNLAGDAAHAATVDDLLNRLADWYRRYPPVGGPPPAGLSREAFLDWAIPSRPHCEPK